ncbi:hypothetical protein HOLleu_24335 [Holothuria leucospilota]|uniref:Endonuclease/exonuclease/phosphatase domain-containing protein n=1 Tax=Holothuria leucospilota TaxID=206669 RepID=A0A9Q1H687_HOLLE|nr:hypothetical protein HOLleu_24335 [Holothuria leucospilota]
MTDFSDQNFTYTVAFPSNILRFSSKCLTRRRHNSIYGLPVNMSSLHQSCYLLLLLLSSSFITAFSSSEVILGNVRSILNKVDELKVCTRYLSEYREASFMCFTEIFLSERVPDSVIDIPNYTLVRGDRTIESGKSRGGVLCFFINDSWCNNFSIKQKTCNTEFESLAIGLRPLYLPREFTQILVTAVYIHPKANADNVRDQLKATISLIENSYPDAANLIMGDFNRCKIGDIVPTYTQYIDLPTRNNNTLDLCYGNIKGRNYKVKTLAQLGSSDHSIIHMSPTYRRELERSKPIVKTRINWNEEAVDQLHECFECTNWTVFDDQNIHDTTITATEYVKFYVDVIIPERSLRIFPNGKPWVFKKLKSLVYEKKAAFSSGD